MTNEQSTTCPLPNTASVYVGHDIQLLYTNVRSRNLQKEIPELDQVKVSMLSDFPMIEDAERMHCSLIFEIQVINGPPASRPDYTARYPPLNWEGDAISFTRQLHASCVCCPYVGARLVFSYDRKAQRFASVFCFL